MWWVEIEPSPKLERLYSGVAGEYASIYVLRTCEREREKSKEREREQTTHTHTLIYIRAAGSYIPVQVHFKRSLRPRPSLVSARRYLSGTQ